MKYHVRAHGDDFPAFTAGLSAAMQLANQAPQKSLLIRVGLLANAKGIMANVLGEKFVKTLIKDKNIRINSQDFVMEIFLEGDSTRRSNFRGGVVFCPWITLDSLDEVMRDRRTIDSVFVPWMPDELKGYLSKYPDSTEIHKN
ncbi:hypothetical protein [Burkholderia gladioli]|uniref:hypothetical protein n=1 Tax=Burkholderia gladioli TaxID=28095 RepID=UPI00163E3A3E|nr:hypothetical protein [Burkholderia gladioli]